MLNNTDTNSTNPVIPVSTKDNSGYIITTEFKSTAGPGGCVIVTTKEEVRFLVTNQTSEYICPEEIDNCSSPPNFTFPTVILPIVDTPKEADYSCRNISTQTTQSNEEITYTKTTVKEISSSGKAKCSCSQSKNKKNRGRSNSVKNKTRVQTKKSQSKQLSKSYSSSSSNSDYQSSETSEDSEKDSLTKKSKNCI